MLNYIIKAFKDAWKFVIYELYNYPFIKIEIDITAKTKETKSIETSIESIDELGNELEKMPLLTRFFVSVIKIIIFFSIFIIPAYFFTNYAMGKEIGLKYFLVSGFIMYLFFKLFCLFLDRWIDSIKNKELK